MACEKLISMHMVCVTLLFHVLIGIATASDYLDISGIRLANGTGPFGGRVEVSINGVWGTVCDDSFDMNDAKVMCRTMNLQATAYVSGAFYGQGIGPIFAQEFKCYGNEQHIKYCKFDVNVQCTHARDISIVCTECGEVDISNGYAKSISEDGSVLTVACKTGFRSNIDTSVCEAGTWSVPSVSCTADVTEIRLVNGIGLYDGRVELLMNGTWGTICSTSFSWQEAGTICKILFGASHWYRTYSTTSYYYGSGTGPIHIDKLDCKTTETDFNQCTYNLDVSCTDHSRDVAVACRVFPLNITNTRLVNGTGPYDGRIELQVDGHWGTIDRRYVDMYDAKTICNTHGASLAMYFDTAKYGIGAGPILTGDMRCYTEKDTINSCTLNYPYRPSSSHSYDLSIACTSCGLPDIYNGNAVAFNGTELTVICHTGFYPNQIKMKCQNNNSWSEEQRCTPVFAFPLNISDIQLKNGHRPSEGRVEILVNGTWGTICDTNFDSADATVICKMLGLEYSSFNIKAKHYSGKGSGPIYVNNLNCSGTESHINLCSYEISNNCTHYDDVAVVCTGYQLEITDIRLAGTNGSYHGRVELKVNGTWGTVCDDLFGWSELSTVCTMFGGLPYRTYFHGAYYGQGSGPIYIDRLDCPFYAHLNDCRYAVDNYYNCGHNEDVSVMCYGPKLNITGARLVNGTGPNDGRAEIKVNDSWGTICDENFNIQAADLFCDLLGLKAAQYFTGAIYGEGSGPVFIDQLFCKDNDNSLSSCKYLFLNECSHGRDISVVCNDCGQPDIYFWGVDVFTYNNTTLYADCSYYRTYVGKLKLTCDNKTQTWITEGECQEYSFPLDVTEMRLVNGTNSTNGRVELKSLGTWGTVCDDRFGMQEANTICSMLGYPPAVTYYVDAHYGPGTGPIFVDDLSCEGDATHINNCTYITYDNCDHDDDVSVVCTESCNPSCKACTSYNNCTACPSGKYGSSCQYECGLGCQIHHCDIDSGKCTCLSNFQGNKCNECVIGKYGNRCDNNCPAGCGNNSCNSNGGCYSCKTGFSGNLCTQCEYGKYGTDCNITCPSGCSNDTCKYNGDCYSCKPGFTGNMCTKCEHGKYGTDCNIPCPSGCSNINCKDNGDCYSCKDWFTGSKCDQCVYGKYGINCEIDCSKNCAYATCDSIAGVCNDGCRMNHYGGQCNMTCATTCVPDGEGRRCFYTNGSCVKDCQNGYYGDMCQERCSENCINIVCLRANGGCKFGCVDGFEGERCTQSISGVISVSKDSSNIETIIGVGVGSVAVTLVAVGIVIIIRRQLRHGHIRRHASEHAHELTVAPYDDIRTIPDSTNIPSGTDAGYVNTTFPVYEELKESKKESSVYDRIDGTI